MHLDEGQVQRLVHGELAPSAATAVREHLAACSDCVSLVAEAERSDGEVAGLLRLLDHTPPRVDVRALMSRAPVAHAAWGRWAAGLLLAAGAAGAAYAAPGTPFKGWITSVLESIGERGPGTPRTRPSTVAPTAAVSGIAVAPGRALLILFTSAEGAGTARIALIDGADVTVRTPIGGATFTSDVDRLVIDNRGSSAGFDIDIPRSAARVEIQVAGRRVFLVQNARVVTATAPDADGRYSLLLSASRH